MARPVGFIVKMLLLKKHFINKTENPENLGATFLDGGGGGDFLWAISLEWGNSLDSKNERRKKSQRI